MVQAQIHLFLNAQGRKGFPDWLRFFGKVVRQFDGFVNIQLLQVEGSSSLGMVLIFKTKAQMETFFDSSVFEQLMRRITPQSIQPYRKVILRAKNLYNYKKQADKPSPAAMRPISRQSPSVEKPQQPSAEKQHVQEDKIENNSKEANVVGIAEFMAQRQKQNNG